MRFATVILAAGASTRMGQPKLLLPWGERTILAHLIGQWMELGAAQIAVVIEAGSSLAAELDRFPTAARIVNPHPELGMCSSVQCAARWQEWKEDATHFVITLGDQPHVGTATLQSILNFAEENTHSICQPARNGRGRHPVVLPKNVFAELPNAKEANLKEFLRARESRRKMFESDDPALDLDIDTPSDYERARLFN